MNVHPSTTPVALASDRTPPSAFRIWPLGTIRTSKGDFLFDQKAAQSVMASYRDQGNLITFDYEHFAVSGTEPGHGKSAGSCNLELRDDGLWAVNVKWTDRAASELAAREWLYFSPAFMSDAKTKRILSLVNIALTNIPATKGMTPLVAASLRETPTMAKKTLQVLQAAALAAFTEYGAARIELDDVEADDVEADDTEEMKAAKAAKMKAAKARLAKAKLEYEAASREAAAFGDGDNDADDGPAAKPAKPSESDELDEEAAAKDPAMCARVTAIASKLTGKKSGAEILGALQALTATRAEGTEVVTLRRELDDVRKELRAERVEKKLVAASKAGKLTPKLRDQAMKIGMRDESELDAFLDALPTSVRTAETKHTPEQRVRTDARSLTKAEEKMCERMCPPGVNLADWKKNYLAQKAENVQRLSAMRDELEFAEDESGAA